MSDEKYTRWNDVPEHLVTKTALEKMGLRVAPDQQVAAIKRGGYGPYDLYDINQAIQKSKPSPAQLAALEKARLQADLNSRCANCRSPFGGEHRYEKIEDIGQGAYICSFCHDKQRVKRLAKDLLASPENVILDTETTGLIDSAEIVEIAICNVAGQILFNSFIRPTIPISDEAIKIHGITSDDLVGAPTWLDVDQQIMDILGLAPKIIIYNAEFDFRLMCQTKQAHGLLNHDYYWWREVENGLSSQMTGIRQKMICAMEMYATWFGDWSNYHQSYTWQPLNGGHRALDDCHATLARLQQMSNNTNEDPPVKGES